MNTTAMRLIQYKIIKTKTQYRQYCDKLEKLIEAGKKSRVMLDEIELLNLLIDKYDAEHNSFPDADPIELIKALMKEHKMKAVDLASLLNVSEGLVSDMLKYKKGLSKETIRILSDRFKLNQEAFNRPYELQIQTRSSSKNTKKRNTRKKLASA